MIWWSFTFVGLLASRLSLNFSWTVSASWQSKAPLSNFSIKVSAVISLPALTIEALWKHPHSPTQIWHWCQHTWCSFYYQNFFSSLVTYIEDGNSLKRKVSLEFSVFLWSQKSQHFLFSSYSFNSIKICFTLKVIT